MDDDKSNKTEFPLTVFFDYLGPCFLQLPRIIEVLLYLEEVPFNNKMYLYTGLSQNTSFEENHTWGMLIKQYTGTTQTTKI